MLNNVQLYYFSPTGGTKACGEVFCKGISQNVSTVNLGLREPICEACGELVVFALPCYGGRVPAVAAEKISSLKGCGKKAVTLVVYGNRDFDDALLELNNTVEARGFQVVASAAVVAQHSVVPSVAQGRPDKADEDEISCFAAQVLERLEKGTEANVSVPGNFPYKDGMNLPVGPICLSECGKCGQCASVCPVGAISVDEEGVKTDAEACFLCMACVAVCPKKARVLPAPLQENMNEKLGALVAVRNKNHFFL